MPGHVRRYDYVNSPHSSRVYTIHFEDGQPTLPYIITSSMFATMNFQ